MAVKVVPIAGGGGGGAPLAAAASEAAIASNLVHANIVTTYSHEVHAVTNSQGHDVGRFELRLIQVPPRSVSRCPGSERRRHRAACDTSAMCVHEAYMWLRSDVAQGLLHEYCGNTAS